MTLTTLLIAPLAAALAGDAKPVSFEAPIQLETTGESFDTLVYPTPVLQDLNGDGKAELVIGDLIGNLFRCDAQSDGKWGAMKPMEAEGEPLKLNNW
tara:strand:- start:4462 stop:4752 length:291 start_codon:yes stop_codon:yes gene_type:complete